MIFSVLSSLLMFLDSFPCIDNKFSRVCLEFFPFPSQNSCRLTRDWECDSEFEGKLYALSILQSQSIGLIGWGTQLGSALGWQS